MAEATIDYQPLPPRQTPGKPNAPAITHAAAAAPGATAASADALGTTILIVDADRRVRQSLAGLIDLADGLTVAGVAADVSSALELMHRMEPALVLIDPRLPDVDAGLALVGLLRIRRPNLRIVVMDCSPELQAWALAVGASGFVEKSGSGGEYVERLLRAAGLGTAVR